MAHGFAVPEWSPPPNLAGEVLDPRRWADMAGNGLSWVLENEGSGVVHMVGSDCRNSHEVESERTPRSGWGDFLKN